MYHSHVRMNDTVSDYLPGLTVPAILFILSGLIGCFGNTFIIIATFRKNSSIRNKCSTLIGILAVADFSSTFNYILTGVITLSRWTYVSNFHCFLIMFPFIASFQVSSYFMFAVGLDRYFGIKYPLFYKNLGKTRYVLSHILIGLAIASLQLGSAGSAVDPELLVPYCTMGTSMVGYALQTGLVLSLLLVVATVVVYVLAYKSVKSHVFPTELVANREKRLLNSLLMVMVIYLLALFIPVVMGIAAHATKTDEEGELDASFYRGLVGSLSYNTNFFIYLWRSEDYRKEFRGILSGWKQLGTHSSGAVAHVDSLPATHRSSRSHRQVPSHQVSHMWEFFVLF